MSANWSGMWKDKKLPSLATRTLTDSSASELAEAAAVADASICTKGCNAPPGEKSVSGLIKGRIRCICTLAGPIRV